MKPAGTGDNREATSGDNHAGRSEDNHSETEGSMNLPGVIAAVLLLICLMLIFYSFNLNSEINQHKKSITQLQEQVNSLQNELERNEKIFSLLSSKEVSIIPLNGLQANPDGYGKVYLDPLHQRSLLQVSRLPALGADSLYVVWVIKNNTPERLESFSINNGENEKLLLIEQLPGISAEGDFTFSVSAETNRTIPQPKGEIYLIGKPGSK